MAFFTSKIDKLEQKPLSSQAVMEIVIQSSKAWNSSQLRVGVQLACAEPDLSLIQLLELAFCVVVETTGETLKGRGGGGRGSVQQALLAVCKFAN